MDWFERGHVAIVTGASRGLGLAVAGELLDRGLRVVIDGRERRALAAAEAALRSRGEVVAIAGDVADPHHAHALIDAARAFGRLDLLINNASTLGQTPLPRIDELGHDTFRVLFDVNVFAPIHLTQHALREMRRRDEPSTVVNITSDAGVEAYPGWGGYGATKAALEHVSRVLALELHGTPVRVLVADPGEMNTPMHREAVPDADPAHLADPRAVARALLAAIAGMRNGFERVRLDAGVPA